MSDPAIVQPLPRVRPEAHVMDLDIAEVHLELVQLMQQSGDIEARMLLAMARRWVREGQRIYGKVQLHTGRDWSREALEEEQDAVFYGLAKQFEDRSR